MLHKNICSCDAIISQFLAFGKSCLGVPAASAEQRYGTKYLFYVGQHEGDKSGGNTFGGQRNAVGHNRTVRRQANSAHVAADAATRRSVHQSGVGLQQP